MNVKDKLICIERKRMLVEYECGDLKRKLEDAKYARIATERRLKARDRERKSATSKHTSVERALCIAERAHDAAKFKHITAKRGFDVMEREYEAIKSELKNIEQVISKLTLDETSKTPSDDKHE